MGVFFFSSFSFLIDGNRNVWVRRMMIYKIIQKISTSALRKRSHPPQGESWTSPRQLHIFMWSILMHRLNHRQRKILALEWASEDELKLASAETPDFQMGVDVCPNRSQFYQSTELISTALHCDWISGMMQALVWLKSWTRTYAFISAGFATESLNSLVRIRKNNNSSAGQTTRKFFDKSRRSQRPD